MEQSNRNASFFLSCYKDTRLEYLCLSNLRKNYPHERIVVSSDGDDDPLCEKIALDFGAEFYKNDQLYLAKHGGKYWIRFLEIFFSNPTDCLIKIDTDTKCWRRLSSMPDGCCAFGDLRPCMPENFLHLQGGCKGLTKEACQKIWESKELEAEWIRHPEQYCCIGFLIGRNGHACEDRYLDRIFRNIGIHKTKHPEICSLFFPKQSNHASFRLTMRQSNNHLLNENMQFAFTHPHKEGTW